MDHCYSIFNDHLKFRIYIRYFCVIILIVLVATQCSRKEERTASTTNQATADKISTAQVKTSLIRELASDPQNLNPVLLNDYTSYQVLRSIFDPLLDIDGSPASNLVGRLAEKWEISADRLTITFYLRPGIMWHDGHPFSAEDVEFTFKMAMREDIPAILLKTTVEPLDRIEVLAWDTIKFYFKYPFAPGLSQIGRVFIIPKHILDKGGLALESQRRGLKKPVTFLTTAFNRAPIGTGPYIFQEWKTAQQIKLSVNQDYWDKENLAKIPTVIFKIIPNRISAFNMLQKGGLDVLRAETIHYLRFQRMEKLGQKFEAIRFLQSSYFYIGWNIRPERKFFIDKKVRKAMTYALDRKSYVEKAGYGLAVITTGPFYFKSWAYNPQIEPMPYDLDKAAELLHSAGWKDHDSDGVLDQDGLKFNFELLLPSGAPTYVQLASIIQANLKNLSIEVSIRVLEWSVYLDKTHRGDFDACLGGWLMGIDPDPYSMWHSSQIGPGNNDIGYINQEVDRLLEQARCEFDREKRQKIYWKIHEIIHDEQPFTFIYTKMETYILSKRIKNYELSPFGLYDFFPGQLSWSLE